MFISVVVSFFLLLFVYVLHTLQAIMDMYSVFINFT